MATEIYIGVYDSTTSSVIPKKITETYIGILDLSTNNVIPKKVTQIYIGDENNNPKLCFNTL